MKNKGLEKWERAKKLIPGGNGLLSKRPERYAPDLWPSYYKNCKGVKVQDLEGNDFIDMAQMGIGTSILGYADEELNGAVLEAVRSGVNCTLNCTEELELAELLLKHNNFADQVKFARSGGEAMEIAIRIARACSGKEKVAFSGYHGWCDWYLSANISNNNNLDDQLLPGLEPIGVPSSLSGTAIPFLYNNSEDFLKKIDLNPDIGIICIEGARYDYPKKEFIETIMKVAREKNIILITDEITSGWRMTDGGVFKLTGFKPDLAIYGKSLGGGFAISAILGKEEIMKFASDTFISSTMWTERVGFVAGLNCLKILIREKGWIHLNKIGEEIGAGWKSLADKHEISLSVTDFKPLITFKLHYDNQNDKILTLFTQEMLKRGYLAASSVYVSMKHTSEIVSVYLKNVDEVFSIMSKAIKKNTVDDLLNTTVRSDSFKRLT